MRSSLRLVVKNNPLWVDWIDFLSPEIGKIFILISFKNASQKLHLIIDCYCLIRINQILDLVLLGSKICGLSILHFLSLLSSGGRNARLVDGRVFYSSRNFNF